MRFFALLNHPIEFCQLSSKSQPTLDVGMNLISYNAVSSLNLVLAALWIDETSAMVQSD